MPLHTGRTSDIGAAKHIQRAGSAVESRRAVGARGRAQRQTLPAEDQDQNHHDEKLDSQIYTCKKRYMQCIPESKTGRGSELYWSPPIP